jgi:hypothetical protein
VAEHCAVFGRLETEDRWVEAEDDARFGVLKFASPRGPAVMVIATGSPCIP